MAIRVVVVCFSILHRTRSVSGHVSHHDRCRVGSVRVSDSVAKKPTSASTDSRVYRRCLRAAPTPPSQKLILRGRTRTKLIRRRRWGRKRTVGISSVVSVPRKNRVPVSGHHLVHGHRGQHLQPNCRARRLDALDRFA